MRLRPSHFNILILSSTLGLLIVSATYGFFRSWDFYTLWGVHPKWVWSTGRFFTPGFELPMNIAYQSFWGSLTGGLLRFLGVSAYPDLSWGLFVGSACFLVTLICWPKKTEKSNIGSFFLCLTFLMIHPREFRQMSMGGYTDLLVTLLLSASALSLSRDKSPLLVSMLAAFLILSKITIWPWVIILLLSFFLARRKMEPKVLILTLATTGVTLLLFKLLYVSQAETPNSLAPMGIQLTQYELLDRIRLPFALLTTQNGWGLIVFFMCLKLRKSLPFAFWFLICGLLLLCAHYTFILGSTPSERYASINRYALPLTLVPAFLLAHNSSLWTEWFKGRIGIFISVVLGLVLVVRGFEEARSLKRQGFWSRFSVCTSTDPVCEAASEVQRQSQNKPECHFFVGSSAWFDRFLGPSEGDLKRLMVIYQALPTRVYLPSSILPRTQETRCDLE
jgi:hypothetical protein